MRPNHDSAYELHFDSEAINFLNTLPQQTKKRIFEKITYAKQQPFHYFERLAAREEYKLRIGNYRVIATIESHTITILHIGHRKNIYDLKKI